MDIETKAKIVMQFTYENTNESLAQDFFDYNDLGVPLSIAYSNNLCTLKDEGIKVIEETYVNLCDEMEVPSDIDYEDITDLHDKWRDLNNGWGPDSKEPKDK